jgi:hypothetical protein
MRHVPGPPRPHQYSQCGVVVRRVTRGEVQCMGLINSWGWGVHRESLQLHSVKEDGACHQQSMLAPDNAPQS